MRKVQVNCEHRVFEFELRQDNGFYYVRQNGSEHKADIVRLGNSRYSLIIDGVSHEIGVAAINNGYSISSGSRSGDYLVEDLEIAKMKKKVGIDDGNRDKSLTAPMPGLIVAVNCRPGDSARRGQRLVVMEAMKMENDIKSPVTGTIKNVAVAVGDSVEKGRLLVEFE